MWHPQGQDGQVCSELGREEERLGLHWLLSGGSVPQRKGNEHLTAWAELRVVGGGRKGAWCREGAGWETQRPARVETVGQTNK